MEIDIMKIIKFKIVSLQKGNSMIQWIIIGGILSAALMTKNQEGISNIEFLINVLKMQQIDTQYAAGLP